MFSFSFFFEFHFNVICGWSSTKHPSYLFKRCLLRLEAFLCQSYDSPNTGWAMGWCEKLGQWTVGVSCTSGVIVKIPPSPECLLITSCPCLYPSFLSPYPFPFLSYCQFLLFFSQPLYFSILPFPSPFHSDFPPFFISI